MGENPKYYVRNNHLMRIVDNLWDHMILFRFPCEKAIFLTTIHKIPLKSHAYWYALCKDSMWGWLFSSLKSLNLTLHLPWGRDYVQVWENPSHMKNHTKCISHMENHTKSIQNHTKCISHGKPHKNHTKSISYKNHPNSISHGKSHKMHLTWKTTQNAYHMENHTKCISNGKPYKTHTKSISHGKPQKNPSHMKNHTKCISRINHTSRRISYAIYILHKVWTPRKPCKMVLSHNCSRHGGKAEVSWFLTERWEDDVTSALSPSQTADGKLTAHEGWYSVQTVRISTRNLQYI